MSRYPFGLILAIALLSGGCASTPGHKAATAKCLKPAPCQATADGWIELFNGKDLTGWKLVHRRNVDSWSVQDGIMANIVPPGEAPPDLGTNLVTVEEFGSCELHIEFKVPEGSNSGAFVNGQYEIQILDSYGQPPSAGACGSIYAQIAPLVNVSKPAGEWQSFDIVFHAPTVAPSGKVTKQARMTVYHNGTIIHDHVEVSEPTGGTYVHEKVRERGPILLQGDHGTVSFRNIRIRPLE
ncbi:MAG TPA: DUF1080 domain-containing protein [bacterium]|nr:DUF1080 domain-containing protein [bacterium]HPO08459.1 DUF1080 domain-containing protein [bacterium]HQO36166.1 DUF1080 domain-containing protein [bacterium]HQP97553.1 DUF1080 domain-containing protein [bacterium]